MNCSFSCDKDKEVFNKIFQYNLRLLCGNNQDKINIIGNKICNYMQKEYGVYFSQDEIRNIQYD